ncbi:MAG: signal peptidase II [Streptomyces sp.]|nr:signal peptidase II [Streptomyces sp.]
MGAAAADQAGKIGAVASAGGGPAPGAGRPSVVRNAGAAFGLGQQWTVVISLVTLAALAGLVVAGLRARRPGWVVALALMAGGAAGNAVDRLLRGPGLLRGAVVDWITVPGYGFTFNLADLALRGGAIMAVLLVVRPVRRTSRRFHRPGKPWLSR